MSRTGGQVGANDFAIATIDRATDPAVTATPGGDFLTVWSSRRASPSAWARRIAPAR